MLLDIETDVEEHTWCLLAVRVSSDCFEKCVVDQQQISGEVSRYEAVVNAAAQASAIAAAARREHQLQHQAIATTPPNGASLLSSPLSSPLSDPSSSSVSGSAFQQRRYPSHHQHHTPHRRHSPSPGHNTPPTHISPRSEPRGGSTSPPSLSMSRASSQASIFSAPAVLPEQQPLFDRRALQPGLLVRKQIAEFIHTRAAQEAQSTSTTSLPPKGLTMIIYTSPLHATLRNKLTFAFVINGRSPFEELLEVPTNNATASVTGGGSSGSNYTTPKQSPSRAPPIMDAVDPISQSQHQLSLSHDEVSLFNKIRSATNRLRREGVRRDGAGEHGVEGTTRPSLFSMPSHPDSDDHNGVTSPPNNGGMPPNNRLLSTSTNATVPCSLVTLPFSSPSTSVEESLLHLTTILGKKAMPRGTKFNAWHDSMRRMYTQLIKPIEQLLPLRRTSSTATTQNVDDADDVHSLNDIANHVAANEVLFVDSCLLSTSKAAAVSAAAGLVSRAGGGGASASASLQASPVHQFKPSPPPGGPSQSSASPRRVVGPKSATSSVVDTPPLTPQPLPPAASSMMIAPSNGSSPSSAMLVGAPSSALLSTHASIGPIPFAALEHPDSGMCLYSRYAISQSHSIHAVIATVDARNVSPTNNQQPVGVVSSSSSILPTPPPLRPFSLSVCTESKKPWLTKSVQQAMNINITSTNRNASVSTRASGLHCDRLPLSLRDEQQQQQHLNVSDAGNNNNNSTSPSSLLPRVAQLELLVVEKCDRHLLQQGPAQTLPRCIVMPTVKRNVGSPSNGGGQHTTRAGGGHDGEGSSSSDSDADSPLANTPRLTSNPAEPESDVVEEDNAVRAFLITFYQRLVRGFTISESHRSAMSEAGRSWSMFPWAWGSFSVLGHGGYIESLTPQCQHVVESCQRLQSHRGRLRAVAASSEAAYLSSSNVPEIYERLIQELLSKRPGTDVGVLDVMIAALLDESSTHTAKTIPSVAPVPTADNDAVAAAAPNRSDGSSPTTSSVVAAGAAAADAAIEEAKSVSPTTHTQPENNQ